MAELNQLEKFIKLLFQPCDIRDCYETSVLYRHDTHDYSFFIKMPDQQDFKNNFNQALWDIQFTLNVMDDDSADQYQFSVPSYLIANIFPLLLNGMESHLNLQFQQRHPDYFKVREYCKTLVDNLQDNKSLLDVPEKFKSFKPCEVLDLKYETQVIFSTYQEQEDSAKSLKEVRHKVFIPRDEQQRYFSSYVCELIYDFEGYHTEDYKQHSMTLLLPNLKGLKEHQGLAQDVREENILHTRLFNYHFPPAYDESEMNLKAQEIYQYLKNVPTLSKEALKIHLEEALPENDIKERKLKI